MALPRELLEFQAKVRQLEGIMPELAQDLADEAVALVLEGFEESKDPYGETWPDPQHRDGKPMLDTARLQNSWHVENATSGGFTIAAGAEYADYLQDGTKTQGGSERMAPRKMVPEGTDLPAKWEERFNEVAVETLQRILE